MILIVRKAVHYWRGSSAFPMLLLRSRLTPARSGKLRLRVGGTGIPKARLLGVRMPQAAVYARISPGGQEEDLERQRPIEYAKGYEDIAVPGDAASGLNEEGRA